MEAMDAHNIQQDVKAKQKLNKAIALGNTKAMNTLGVMYWLGEGIEQNLCEGERIL